VNTIRKRHSGGKREAEEVRLRRQYYLALNHRCVRSDDCTTWRRNIIQKNGGETAREPLIRMIGWKDVGHDDDEPYLPSFECLEEEEKEEEEEQKRREGEIRSGQKKGERERERDLV
jgi:hypothetical protein